MENKKEIALALDEMNAIGEHFSAFVRKNIDSLNDDYLDAMNIADEKNLKVVTFPEFCYIAWSYEIEKLVKNKY